MEGAAAIAGHSIENPGIRVYGICADQSNAMLSNNPHSGIYEAETARTLDLNGGSPVCNQGGMAVVSWPDVTNTLPARMDGSPCIDRGPPIVACLNPWDPQSKRVFDPEGAAPTLSSGTAEGMNIVPSILQVYDARGNGDGVTCPTITGDHFGHISDYTAILQTFSMQAFGDYKDSDAASAIKSRDYKDATDLIVAAVDCRNGKINEDVNGTLQAKEQGFNLNSNNVVLTWKGDIEDATARNSILRILRETYGTEKTIKWGLAILATLQQADILRQGMHESCIQKQSENWRQLVNTAPPCEEIVTEWLLRDLRERQECGCSSSGWESAEQFKGEPTTSLPELPHKSPSTAEELFSMWEAGKGIGLLLQALYEIQKIWRSNGRQTWVIYPEVRRLTPLEACRLQGFPDGWLDIGDWTDENGKLHKESDAPKYKAAGNSIALPFWEWLARQICARYERPITMGSLFSGIGGFELVFQKCGATPVWSSEIEQYPIAVLKKHFPE